MSEIKDVTELIREKYGEKKVDESEMARELMVRGFEQKLMELYEDFKRMGNSSQITYHKLQRINKQVSSPN